MNKNTAIAVALALLATATILAVSIFSDNSARTPKNFTEDFLSNKVFGEEEIIPIPITSTYSGGVYTYTGSIDLPTACHSLSIEGVRTESVNEVGILFTVEAPEEDIVCAQVITPQPFVISFAAPESVRVLASLNDTPVVFVSK